MVGLKIRVGYRALGKFELRVGKNSPSLISHFPFLTSIAAATDIALRNIPLDRYCVLQYLGFAASVA